MLMKHFTIFLVASLSIVGIGKESLPSFPALPSGYTSKQALVDITVATEPAASVRLRSWFFHQSFGGEQLKLPALEQPRLAQALWLALTTQALKLRQTPIAEAVAHMDHLCRQKAVPTSTLEFFTALWSQESVSTDRAAVYLQDWLQPHHIVLSAEERAAVRSALDSGCSALAFLEKNLNPVQSAPTR